jgi:hypothetical protein
MPKRTVALVSLALGLTPSAMLHAAGPSVGGPVESGLGFNIHFTTPRAGEMEELAAAGVRWVRMDFSWEATERVAGQYDFAAYDKLLAACEAHGLRAMLILDYRNAAYDEGLSPHTAAGRAAFARWAAAAAVHFKGRGVLWEMYNEPNIGFWKPKPNVDDYVALALETGKALRAAAPDELYCGPASSTMDMPFLEKCFQGGLLDYWCAVTVHPYRQTAPETVVDDYRRLRVLIHRYAPRGANIPIISGEWGYSSVWKGFDADRQGRFLPRQWLVNGSQDVPLSIWYDWHEDGTQANEPEHHFGTVHFPYRGGQDPVYEPKPAYLAAQTLASQLRGFRLNKRLTLADPRDWLLLFARGDEVRLAVWTASPTPHEVRLPFGGKFARVGHIGQTLPALEAGAPLTVTEAVQYLTPDPIDDTLRAAAAWSRAPLDYLADGDTRQLTLTSTFSNPVERALSVRLALEGIATAGPRAEAPRDQLKVTSLMPVTRDDTSRTVRSELSIDGAPPLVQESVVCQTAPLVVSCLSVSRDGLPVRLANPSGAAFRGTLQLQGVEGLSLQDESQAVELAAGRREQTVRVRPAARHVAEPGVPVERAAAGLRGPGGGDGAESAVRAGPRLRRHARPSARPVDRAVPVPARWRRQGEVDADDGDRDSAGSRAGAGVRRAETDLRLRQRLEVLPSGAQARGGAGVARPAQGARRVDRRRWPGPGDGDAVPRRRRADVSAGRGERDLQGLALPDVPARRAGHVALGRRRRRRAALPAEPRHAVPARQLRPRRHPRRGVPAGAGVGLLSCLRADLGHG